MEEELTPTQRHLKLSMEHFEAGRIDDAIDAANRALESTSDEKQLTILRRHHERLMRVKFPYNAKSGRRRA